MARRLREYGGRRTKRLQGGDGPRLGLRYGRPRAVDPEQRDERRFSARGVLGRGFAHDARLAGRVQEIVHKLKHEPDLAAEPSERRPPARIRASEHGPRLAAGGDEGARLH